jgi:hypothetical protein
MIFQARYGMVLLFAAASTPHLQCCFLCTPDSTFRQVAVTTSSTEPLQIPAFREVALAVSSPPADAVTHAPQNGVLRVTSPAASPCPRPVDRNGYDAGVSEAFFTLYTTGRLGMAEYRASCGMDRATAAAQLAAYDREVDSCTMEVRTQFDAVCIVCAPPSPFTCSRFVAVPCFV